MIMHLEPGAEATAGYNSLRAEKLEEGRRIDISLAAKERIERVHAFVGVPEIAGADGYTRAVQQVGNDYFAFIGEVRELSAKEILLQERERIVGDVLVFFEACVVEDAEEQRHRVAM